MLLFCSTNFPVLRRTRPDAKGIVPQNAMFSEKSHLTEQAVVKIA